MATFASRTLLSGSRLAASWRHLLDPRPLKCWGPRFVGVSLTGVNRGAFCLPPAFWDTTKPLVEHEFSWSRLGWVVSHSPGVCGSTCTILQGNSSRCTETADFSSLSLTVRVKSQLSVAAPLRSPVLTGSLSRWFPRTGLAVPAPWLAPSPCSRCYSACCAEQVLIGATELCLHSVPRVFSMATPFTPPNRLLLSRPVRAGEGPGSGTSSVSACCQQGLVEDDQPVLSLPPLL